MILSHVRVVKTYSIYNLGSDGWIRVWDLSNICNASQSMEPDVLDNSFFRMDPMNEVEVESGANLTSIAKSKQGGEQNIWFLQVNIHFYVVQLLFQKKLHI